MAQLGRKQALMLLFGDLVCFAAALWLSLALRYLAMPSQVLLLIHLPSFTLLWLISVVVFFIAGLYEKHTLVFKSYLPQILFRAQIGNVIVAIAFFYLFPVGIEPRATLFFYVVISSLLIFFWRLYNEQILSSSRKTNALFIGSGKDIDELIREIGDNVRYSLCVASQIDSSKFSSHELFVKAEGEISKHNISVVVAHGNDEKLKELMPQFYHFMVRGVRFVDIETLYEGTFDRIPLSFLNYDWFFDDTALASRFAYDLLKRLMDIIIASALGLVSLVFYPFVYLLIKLDDGGNIFISQLRVGKLGKAIRIYKFRSMSGNDQGQYDPSGKTKLVVTPVGKFLRASRLDELPQLWNVLRGDLSLIGPRPELPALVSQYEAQIPYYSMRHLVTPGLSGWAQLYGQHAHHGIGLDETRNKFSYDLYYVKHRSFLLDLKIALRTIQTLLSRAGS